MMALDLKHLTPLDVPIEINGVKITGEALAEILNHVTNPDPKRWYRYRRQGDQIVVDAKVEP